MDFVRMQSVQPDLIAILRATANRVESGAEYRWAHMGSCNCGHLAQALTNSSRAEIHRRAQQQNIPDHLPAEWVSEQTSATPTPRNAR